MKKYVVIHNAQEKQSRDFVDQLGQFDCDVIDWYSSEISVVKSDYCKKEMPAIAAFPSVVDTELKLICSNPATIQAALDYFEVELSIPREKKLEELRFLRDAKLLEVDIMINQLVLGLRSDTTAINTYRNALLTITDDYKDQSGNATEDIDDLVLMTITWPVKPE